MFLGALVAVLGVEPRVLHTLGKFSTLELQSQAAAPETTPRSIFSVWSKASNISSFMLEIEFSF